VRKSCRDGKYIFLKQLKGKCGKLTTAEDDAADAGVEQQAARGCVLQRSS
jgi:hypothetical protein